MTKLGLDDATIALLAAIDAAPADEEVHEFVLDAYAARVGGGYYWELVTRRIYASSPFTPRLTERESRVRMKRQVLEENVALANERHAEVKA